MNHKPDLYASESETQDLIRIGKLPKALRLAEFLETHPHYTPAMGKAADELRRLHRVEIAYKEWIDKTEWVQETAQPCELGMHRADVLRQRLGSKS